MNRLTYLSRVQTPPSLKQVSDSRSDVAAILPGLPNADLGALLKNIRGGARISFDLHAERVLTKYECNLRWLSAGKRFKETRWAEANIKIAVAALNEV